QGRRVKHANVTRMPAKAKPKTPTSEARSQIADASAKTKTPNNITKASGKPTERPQPAAGQKKITAQQQSSAQSKQNPSA
ncbi:hypothetical protein, partial [Paraburkholderia sp. XV]|uniref:hypothetical protein n=1 Tax=Paraburkholderia sp. XV TaxID=2831520 RepID=UPI001CD4A488